VKTQWKQYLLDVRKYCFKGNVGAEDVEDDWRVENKENVEWFHVPWQHFGPKGREGIHAMTKEAPVRPRQLASKQTHGDGQTYAVALYNKFGGYTIWQVWKDPHHPGFEGDKRSAINFPVGTVVCKVLFVDLHPEDKVPFLDPPRRWQGYITKGYQSAEREICSLSWIQMDVMVRHSQAPYGVGLRHIPIQISAARWRRAPLAMRISFVIVSACWLLPLWLGQFVGVDAMSDEMKSRDAIDKLIAEATGEEATAEQARRCRDKIARIASRHPALVDYLCDRYVLKCRDEWELGQALRVLHKVPLDATVAPLLLHFLSGSPARTTFKRDVVFVLTRLADVLPIETYCGVMQQSELELKISLADKMMIHLRTVSDPAKRLQIVQLCLSLSSCADEELRKSLLDSFVTDTPGANPDTYIRAYETEIEPHHRALLLSGLIEAKYPGYSIHDDAVHKLSEASPLAKWYIEQYKAIYLRGVDAYYEKLLLQMGVGPQVLNGVEDMKAYYEELLRKMEETDPQE
jgi:hypothetical protein